MVRGAIGDASPRKARARSTPDPERWAEVFAEGAERRNDDDDAFVFEAGRLRMKREAALKPALGQDLEEPLLSVGAKGEDAIKTSFKALLYGVINAIACTPVMIGFAAIIFRHEAFHRDPAVYSQLVKLVLFSSAVHQATFSFTSSLPFAIGQVAAALRFLSQTISFTLHLQLLTHALWT